MSTTTRRTTRRAAGLVAVLALTAGAGLTACGDDSGSDPSGSSQVSTTQHDSADVTFATDMIQHHAQALSMVDLMQGRSVDPQVQKLADAIRDAQGPEIETMSDWLTSWGEQVPATMRDHTNADGMGDMGGSGHGTEDMHGFADMPGMMSADDMQSLQDAPDAEFQDMWLQMMIEHHQGAVEMAKTEIADGRYKPAVDLAKQIVASQTKEIETMQGMLS